MNILKAIISFALLATTLSAQVQYADVAKRIIRGNGTPAAGNCANLSAVGSKYQNYAPAGSEYTCQQTSAGVFGWVVSGSGGGTGDVSSDETSTTDGQLTLFSGTGGKTIKKSTISGVLKITSGVPAAVTGTSSDCVKVDGSSGACGSGAVSSVTAGPSGAVTASPTTGAVVVDIDTAYVPQKIATGTSVLGTSSISANTCATVVTTTATGTATTDVITYTPNADITSATGYGVGASDGLRIYPYPSANNVNWKVCNYTGSSITPGAVTLNWKVIR